MAIQLAGEQLDLAGLRQRKGLSLREIARETKIGVNYLDAIERGLFSKLPGGIYNVSYIRQYARAIECDEARLLDYYRASAAVS
jgi:cytoskeleton protein RodZ